MTRRFTWMLVAPLALFGPIAVAAVAVPVDTSGVVPVDAGEVVPVDALDLSDELTHGRSATEFTLQLPDGAACPGDSLNDQWRVQSFIIPAADDPGIITYGANGPEGPGQYALYELNTSPYTDILTRQNLVVGEPGIISPIPPLSFAVFPPRTLPSGSYRIGIACTYFRATANYWDVEIVMTESADDEPGRLLWRLASAPTDVADADDGGLSTAQWLIIAVVVAVLSALGFILLGRSGPAVPIAVRPRAVSSPAVSSPAVNSKESK